LHHAVKAGPVGLGRGAADRVDDRIDLVSFARRRCDPIPSCIVPAC
jgi:hypothetical protein